MQDDEHKKLVKGLIENFEKRHLKIISASYDGYNKCELIGSHEPDVIAQDDGNKFYIGEAKTCESLLSERTREQFEDFANAVLLNEGATREYLPFCICVPKNCFEELKRCLIDYGLSMNKNIETLTL